MSKIVGITVGTPISPSLIKEKINPVTSVNGIEADEKGNVEVQTGAVTDEQITSSIEKYLEENPPPAGKDGKTPTIEVEENYTSNTGRTGVMLTIKQPLPSEDNGDGTQIVPIKITNVPIYHGTNGKNGVVPNIASVKVESIDSNDAPSGSISGTPEMMVMSLKIPRENPAISHLMTLAWSKM